MIGEASGAAAGRATADTYDDTVQDGEKERKESVDIRESQQEDGQLSILLSCPRCLSAGEVVMQSAAPPEDTIS